MITPDPAVITRSIVRATIDIAATPDDVFEALTNPRELAAWLGGIDDYSPDAWSLEAAPGVPWSAPAISPDGEPGTVRGEFLVVDEPRRVVTTWRASWDHFARDIVRYELEEIEIEGTTGTRLTVTHGAPAACARRVRDHGRRTGPSVPMSGRT